jgi:hypothetical protein
LFEIGEAYVHTAKHSTNSSRIGDVIRNGGGRKVKKGEEEGSMEE